VRRRSDRAYDAAAATFDRHRKLPEGVAQATRGAVLRALDLMRRRLVDLGAGTGRIVRAFVEAGDAYAGVDVSLGMLREFARNVGARDGVSVLLQASAYGS
jgi:predicted TPR repeat methyltransferase